MITIRVGCPDVWVDGTRYALPGDVQASVREAFENPPWAGVADLVTQCVGYDRPQPIAELVGLPSSQAVERVREQGLPVRTLGSGSGCRTGSPKPYNGGRMTLVVSDSGVVLWANRG